jgi:hypothetical protein
MAVDEEEKKNEEEKDMELDLMAEAELLRLTRFLSNRDRLIESALRFTRLLSHRD